MHLSIVTHGRLIGDYHPQHPFVAYTLHDRAGTLASLLHKAEMTSVRLSVGRLAGNSVVSACIDMGLALRDSYVLWHVQVCFKTFLSAIVCSPKR